VPGSKQFLAYFTTSRANNGGTEASNGVIELHRRGSRGFRNLDNYRLRRILAAGRLTDPISDEPVIGSMGSRGVEGRHSGTLGRTADTWAGCVYAIRRVAPAHRQRRRQAQ
jgi:Transposase